MSTDRRVTETRDLLTNPDGAAALVHGLLGGLRSAAGSLSSFVSNL